MKIRIIVLTALLMTSAAYAGAEKEYVGEVLNPCGDPIRFTSEEVEISAKLDSTGATEVLIYKGHRYPKGFFFYYSQSDGTFEHENWKELKAIVQSMADEVGFSVEEKCKGKEDSSIK